MNPDRGGPFLGMAEATALLNLEARLLDERRFDEWLALLTEDVSYRVPLTRGSELLDREIAIVDDNRRRLASRVWHVSESGLNHSQDPPVRTVRTVSNVELSVTTPDKAEVECALVIYEHRAGAQRQFDLLTHPARSRYVLRKVGDTWLIAVKEVDLLLRDAVLGSLTFIV